MIDIYNIIALILLFASLPVIILAEIRRRFLTEKRLRALLPDEPRIRRKAISFDIIPQSVPDTENGRMFLGYRRKKLRETFVVDGVTIVVAMISMAVITIWPR